MPPRRNAPVHKRRARLRESAPMGGAKRRRDAARRRLEGGRIMGGAGKQAIDPGQIPEPPGHRMPAQEPTVLEDRREQPPTPDYRRLSRPRDAIEKKLTRRRNPRKQPPSDPGAMKS